MRSFAPLRRLAVACLLASLTTPAFAQKATGAKPDAAPETTWNDRAYLNWLVERSMLHQAGVVAADVSGRGLQWRNQYAQPQPREAVEAASVWVLGYPGSVITRPGESVIASWADPELWAAFESIGIELLHTGPVKRSGGLRGREHTPTIDGWFDRISLEIDPQLGTDADYRRMVETAAQHGGLVAGDLVPLHTGKGADFQLALRNYGEYPGMYTMVEIDEEDWPLLPEVDDLWSSEPVPKDTARALLEEGYLPGLIDSADASPEAPSLSGWDATAAIPGADGKTRRWVYLHYFKPGQPTLNWLDPTLAGPRALAGDVTRTVADLGAKMVRLDAVPFLGLENREGTFLAWGYMHPLSVQGTDQLAMMTRKLGGWSFQELNVPLNQLSQFTEHGPDLSYDFFTRTEGVHALLSGDAGPLRLAFGFLLQAGVPAIALVHDLQNHDEITYQLVQLDHRGDDTLRVDGREVLGRVLREQILEEMRTRAAGPKAPYNLLYRATKDGLATTMAGFVAASLEIEDPYQATPEQIEQIRRGHLLLTALNALQPGVFSLSSWDLVGALPLQVDQVADRIDDGDYRWINRGGVDLLGRNPDADRSAFGLPRAQVLYGPLPEQLKDPESYASQLKRMLAARKRHGIAGGDLIAAPEPANASACLLLMRLPGRPRLAVTALNFGREPIEESVDLTTAKAVDASRIAGRSALDIVEDRPAGKVGEDGTLSFRLEPLQARTFVIEIGRDD